MRRVTRLHREAAVLADLAGRSERALGVGCGTPGPSAPAIAAADPCSSPSLTLWPPSTHTTAARQYGFAATALVKPDAEAGVQGRATDVYVGGAAAPAFRVLHVTILQVRRRPASVAQVVKVVTGNLRGAGTHSPAWIRLIGSNGTSETFKLGEEDTFDRGSARVFSVAVPAGSLGQLRRVFIEKRKQAQLGDGWFLKHVEVEGPSPDDRTLFPCNAWLGESDCGGFSGGLFMLQGANWCLALS